MVQGEQPDTRERERSIERTGEQAASEGGREQRPPVYDSDAWDGEAIGWLAGTGIAAYALPFVLAGFIPGDPTPLESSSQAFELVFLAALNALEVDSASAGSEGSLLLGLPLAALVVGPFLVVGGYLLAARVADGSKRRYATFGASVAVPFALTVAWRASEFRETITYAADTETVQFGGDSLLRQETTTFVGEPVAALVGAAILAAVCGAIGGWLAGRRRS